jgi:hypothetical protein
MIWTFQDIPLNTPGIAVGSTPPDTKCIIDVSQYAYVSVQATSGKGSVVWTTARLRVRRSVFPFGPFVDMDTPVELSPSSPMSVAIPVAFPYLAIEVTTVEGSTAYVTVGIWAGGVP